MLFFCIMICALKTMHKKWFSWLRGTRHGEGKLESYFPKGYLLSFDMAHAPDYFDEEHGM